MSSSTVDSIKDLLIDSCRGATSVLACGSGLFRCLQPEIVSLKKSRDLSSASHAKRFNACTELLKPQSLSSRIDSVSSFPNKLVSSILNNPSRGLADTTSPRTGSWRIQVKSFGEISFMHHHKPLHFTTFGSSPKKSFSPK